MRKNVSFPRVHSSTSASTLVPSAWPAGEMCIRDRGKISANEIKALVIFALTVFLWATDGKHLQLFGFQISLVMVAVFSVALFFLPYIGILSWKESNIPWDLMILSLIHIYPLMEVGDFEPRSS